METLDRHASDLRVAFRPVADLRRGDTASYEALVALPDEDPRSPAEWSDHGRVEHAGAVEGLLLELALAARRKLPPRTVLVVTLSAPALVTAPVQQALAAAGALDRVLLSIVEGDPIETFAVGAALEAAREEGARIAVDAGPAALEDLERIVRLRPELVRAGGQLVHHVADDLACAAAMESLVSLARRLDADVLAADVRREADLRMLARMGAGLAAGPIVGMAAGAIVLPKLRTLRGGGARVEAWSRRQKVAAFFARSAPPPSSTAPRALTPSGDSPTSSDVLAQRGERGALARKLRRRLRDAVEVTEWSPFFGGLPTAEPAPGPAPFLLGVVGKWR